MPTCSFCKKNYEIPRGLTVFTFDGRSIFYCSSKCRRNANLKRDPKKVNWVKKDKTKKKVREAREVKEKVEKKEDDTPVFDASTKKNKKDFGEFKFE